MNIFIMRMSYTRVLTLKMIHITAVAQTQYVIVSDYVVSLQIIRLSYIISDLCSILSGWTNAVPSRCRHPRAASQGSTGTTRQKVHQVVTAYIMKKAMINVHVKQLRAAGQRLGC